MILIITILHIDSPDSDVWREGISLPKPYIEFEEDVYYETMVIIGCGSDEQNQNLFKSFTLDMSKVIYTNNWWIR